MERQIERILKLMESGHYVADREIATALHLAIVLGKPLLVEGHAGVGKTEIAKVLALTLETDLIRLQCYEGLDASTALYEWNYSKQMLRIKLSEGSGQETAQREQEIFSESFLLKRPLLQAITHNGNRPVLLIDEIDRCVSGDTLVATTTGVKYARDVGPGDQVLSFDPSTFRSTTSLVKKARR